MNNNIKGKAKNILAWVCLPMLMILTYRYNVFANYKITTHYVKHSVVDSPPINLQKVDTSNIILPKKQDSTKPRVPSISAEKIIQIDSNNKTPFVDTFNFRTSKDSLSAPVVYHADDSMVIDIPGQKMYLYGKVSNVKYEDNDLSAPQIQFDQRTSLVSAFLKKDSNGRVVSYPFFAQKDFQSVSDTIRFNMKTGKGLTKGTYTKQGEMFVYGEKIKKADTSSFYALNGRFTTCNLDTPHFAFVAKKVKFVNKKWAYTGPVHPEFEGVPLPISLPFGIFPLTQGRHSGLLTPSFAANAQLGISLENLGYYKIISPNWDVVTRGTLYSYGSYTLSVNPKYYRRYHYQGNIGVNIQNIKQLDATPTKTINVVWSHSSDSKARPGVTFNANVNAGSTKYNSQVPNSPIQNFQNQLNSSITYAKVWKNKPYNISISANHNQNSVTGLTNLNLPDIAFNVNTQYPFRRAEPIGDYKWYENIGIAYNGTAKSLTSFYDTATNIVTQIRKNLQYGAQHNLPITLALPPLGVIQLAPGVTYQERWYQRRVEKQYNYLNRKVDTVSVKDGFFTARQMSFSLAASTRIFGMFVFGKNSKIKAIRHEIRPSISLAYSPNFNAGNNYFLGTEPLGILTTPTSYYEGSIYGAFSNQKFGGLNFNIDNNISAKVRDKTDTSAKADKKISLLDGLGISSAYNFLQDSFKLQNISVSARSNLFEKINITASANFDPYQTNSLGRRINKYVWAKKPISLGNLINANIALQTSFKGGDKNKKTNPQQLDQTLNSTNINGMPLDEYQREAAYIQNNPAEFVDFEIPWSVDLSYSFQLTRSFNIANNNFTGVTTQGVVFNSSANLTPKWKVGTTGTFNVTGKKLEVLTAYLSRDLHDFSLAINLAPIGNYRFFSINIAAKSAILKDLKVNRTRSFSNL